MFIFFQSFFNILTFVTQKTCLKTTSIFSTLFSTFSFYHASFHTIFSHPTFHTSLQFLLENKIFIELISCSRETCTEFSFQASMPTFILCEKWEKYAKEKDFGFHFPQPFYFYEAFYPSLIYWNWHLLTQRFLFQFSQKIWIIFGVKSQEIIQSFERTTDFYY